MSAAAAAAVAADAFRMMHANGSFGPAFGAGGFPGAGGGGQLDASAFRAMAASNGGGGGSGGMPAFAGMYPGIGPVGHLNNLLSDVSTNYCRTVNYYRVAAVRMACKDSIMMHSAVIRTAVVLISTANVARMQHAKRHNR